MQECAETGCAALNITEYWQGVMCVRQGQYKCHLRRNALLVNSLSSPTYMPSSMERPTEGSAPHGSLEFRDTLERNPDMYQPQVRMQCPQTSMDRAPYLPYVPCLQNLRHLLLETQFSGENRAATSPAV